MTVGPAHFKCDVYTVPPHGLNLESGIRIELMWTDLQSAT